MAQMYPVYKQVAEALHNNPELARKIPLSQLEPILGLSGGAPGVLLQEDTLQKVRTIYQCRRKIPSKPRKYVLKAPKAPKAPPTEPETSTTPKVLTIKKTLKVRPVIRKTIKPVKAVKSVKAVKPVQPVKPVKPVKFKVKPIKFTVTQLPPDVESSARKGSRPADYLDSGLLVLAKELISAPLKARKVDNMSSLRAVLRAADQAYYLDGEPFMTDEIYDAVVDIYQEKLLAGGKPYDATVGVPLTGKRSKKKMPVRLGSMTK